MDSILQVDRDIVLPLQWVSLIKYLEVQFTNDQADFIPLNFTTPFYPPFDVQTSPPFCGIINFLDSQLKHPIAIGGLLLPNF